MKRIFTIIVAVLLTSNVFANFYMDSFDHFNNRKGVKFLGTVILPNQIYIANRTKGNLYNALEKQNQIPQVDHRRATILSKQYKLIPWNNEVL